MTELDDEADRAKQAAAEAIKARPMAEPVETAARIAYAMIAGSVSYFLARYFLDMEEEGAKEISLLNGGVAYYTHEAAGKVVAAMNLLYRTWRRDRYDNRHDPHDSE